jgi:hypothetical protein
MSSSFPVHTPLKKSLGWRGVTNFSAMLAALLFISYSRRLAAVTRQRFRLILSFERVSPINTDLPRLDNFPLLLQFDANPSLAVIA